MTGLRSRAVKAAGVLNPFSCPPRDSGFRHKKRSVLEHLLLACLTFGALDQLYRGLFALASARSQCWIHTYRCIAQCKPPRSAITASLVHFLPKFLGGTSLNRKSTSVEIRLSDKKNILIRLGQNYEKGVAANNGLSNGDNDEQRRFCRS